MDNNNMNIQTTYNDKFQCNWYHCKIKNETFSSPRIKDVEEWREDKIVPMQNTMMNYKCYMTKQCNICMILTQLITQETNGKNETTR